MSSTDLLQGSERPKTSPFPSQFEDRYYVYTHVHPGTNSEVLYIGHGCKFRAWVTDTPFRSEEHAKYLEGLMNIGYIPSDWVNIVAKGMTKEDACVFEREQIKLLKPRFNKIQGEKLLKFTPEVLELAIKLREGGMSYKQIANELELSVMVVHRGMNGNSPALEELLERRK